MKGGNWSNYRHNDFIVLDDEQQWAEKLIQCVLDAKQEVDEAIANIILNVRYGVIHK